jgi:subtilisin family serine protease
MANYGRIKAYGSWMDGESGGERPLNEASDVDGHGTHAAGLILKVAPYAEICIARIAGVNDGLPNGQGIAKVSRP